MAWLTLSVTTSPSSDSWMALPTAGVGRLALHSAKVCTDVKVPLAVSLVPC